MKKIIQKFFYSSQKEATWATRSAILAGAFLVFSFATISLPSLASTLGNGGGLPLIAVAHACDNSNMSIDPTTLPDGIVGTNYAQELSVAGTFCGSEQWTVASGTLPTGLILDGTTQGRTFDPRNSVGRWSLYFHGAVLGWFKYGVTIVHDCDRSGSGCFDPNVNCDFDSAGHFDYRPDDAS